MGMRVTLFNYKTRRVGSLMFLVVEFLFLSCISRAFCMLASGEWLRWNKLAMRGMGLKWIFDGWSGNGIDELWLLKCIDRLSFVVFLNSICLLFLVQVFHSLCSCKCIMCRLSLLVIKSMFFMLRYG
jgi:hypothetical protein